MANLVLNHNADMVIGDRLSSTYFQENKRPFHNAGNIFVRNTINQLFGSNIKDIMTGYRAFSYRFVKTFPVLSRKFEIETEMCIHAIDKHMQIENLKIDYKNRPEGSLSKLNTYLDGIRILKTYLSTGLVPRLPTLIASGFLLIAALQLMGIGITLQTIKKKNRQDFEIDLYRVMEQEKE